MARMVQCRKLGQLLPGLEKPPFPGELGDRIFEEISASAYDSWTQFATMLINHHGLNLGNPSHRDFLVEQMEEFFFGAEPEIEGWVPPGQAPAKGGPTKGAPSKGGPTAPQRK